MKSTTLVKTIGTGLLVGGLIRPHPFKDAALASDRRYPPAPREWWTRPRGER